MKQKLMLLCLLAIGLNFNLFAENRPDYGLITTPGTCTPPTPTISGELVICPGGSRVLTASGGVAYVWSTGATNASITVNTAATYTVTATDAGGSTATATATTIILSAGTLSPLPPPGSQGSPVCYGSTLQMSSTVPGGVWSTISSFPVLSIDPTTGLVTPLTAWYGTDTTTVAYAVSATGCTATAFVRIEVRGLNPGTISGQTNLCYNIFGQTTTQLSTNGAAGGVWASSNPAITVNSSGLVTTSGPGTTTISYTITSEGCANSTSTQVTWNAYPNTLVTIPFLVCEGPSYPISVPDAGAGTTYTWTGDGIVNANSNSTTFTPTPGYQNYTVTIMPANGCGATGYGSTTVNALPNTMITATPNPACLGVTLSLSIPVAASTTVTWSGPDLNSTTGFSTTATPSTSGLQTYTVTALTDPYLGSCSSTSTVDVMVSPAISLSTIVTNTCSGSSTGAIDLTASAGTPAYTYNWGGGVTTEDRSNLAAGTYTVIVSDASGCTKTISATVGANPLPTVNFSFSPNDTVCVGTPTMITASGGTQYNWSTGATTATTTVIPTGFGAGYSVTVTNAAGCSKVGFVYIVTNQLPSITPTIVQPTCSGADGSISLLTSGSFFNWSTPDGSGLVSGQKNQSGLTVGTYNVTVTTSSGCTATASYVLSGPANCCPAIGSVSASPSPACAGENVTLTTSGLTNMASTYGIIFKSFSAATSDPYTGGTTLATVANGALGAGGTTATATVTFASGGTNFIYAILTPTPTNAACRPSATTTLVVDNTLPMISCPANISVSNTTGLCSAIASYATPVGTDNCSGPNTIQTAGLASGSLFAVGVTTNTFKVTDAANNTSTCAFTVTVNDTQLPTITCPANISVSNTTGLCSAVVSYTTPSGTDNCSGQNTIQTAGLASGSSFAVGVTTNTFKVTDTANNNATCAFTVTVNDTQAPTITCPANLSVSNTTGLCSAVVSYTTPSGTDNCSGQNTIQTAGLASGSSFAVGVTTNTFKVTDAANNTSTCAFTVTVNDTQLPTITCPANISVSNTTGLCSATVSYTTPSGTDNCSGQNTIQTAGLASGSSFAVGVTTNTFKVTDAANNTSTCAFTVTVNDTQLPTITCPANISVSNTTGLCSAVVSYTTPSGTDNCSGPNTIQTAGLASGSSFAVGVTTNTFKVTDTANNTSTCAFTVTVNDTQLPTITCPANISVSNTTGLCSAVVSYTTPSGTDNCSGQNTIQTAGLASGSSFAVGVTTNTFKVTDAANNTSTCAFTVTVNDTQLPTITCPANISVSNTTGLCSATVSYTSPSGTDNCSGQNTIQTAGLASGSSFAVGVTTNTFKVTDAANNTSTCAFTVTVNDTQLPTITCPANISVSNTTGLCSATVSYTSPSGTDNCSGQNTVQTAGLASGSSFAVGVTTNTFKVTDAANNTSTCAFTVTVNDTQLPTITCPANISVSNTTGLCSATVSYTTPAGTDNCSGPNTVQTAGLASGSSFAVGVTTNTFKVTDAANNTSTCAFTVTVNDTQLPTITCPANISVSNTTGLCSATVSYTTPSGTDNCSGPNTIQTAGLASGSSFAVGVTTNTFQVTDAANNTSTCAFTVTVNDTQLPLITCPANISVSNTTGLCSATVSYTTPSGTDNCSGPNTIQTAGLASGSSFAVGVTTNTFQVTDAANNTSTCAFTVTVNDTQLPTITCPANISVSNTTGLCSAVVSYTTPSGTDNCSGQNTVQTAGLASGSSFAVGVTTNTFKVTDAANNTSTCAFTVTVNDTQLPTITCPANIAANNDLNQCSAVLNYIAPVGTDNCSGATTTRTTGLASGSTFPVGVTINTFKVTDGANNSVTCSFTVTVTDTQAPSIICPANQTVSASVNCSGQVGARIPSSKSDNCTPSASITVTQTPSPSTLLVGHNSSALVTLTASDANGNTASCSFTVTLKDVSPPVAKCKNISTNLDVNGSVTVATSAVNNGSTDNCTYNLTLTPNTFTCANIGSNLVTLRATDAAGNTAACTAKVMVKDMTGPTARCKNPTIYLDDFGNASLSVAQVNNGSTDACGISTMSISKTLYNCGEITGPNSVTLSLTDIHGNSSSCLASVKVLDALPPTAVCEDVTVQLAANGKVVVYPSDLASNSYDNCSVYTYSPSAKLYTTANIGPNNLSIIVKDFSGNQSTCVSVVTVEPFSGLRDQGDAHEGLPNGFAINVYPNPTSGDAYIAFELPTEQPVILRLFDLQGRMILNQEVLGLKGENILPLHLKGFAPGMYLLDFQSGSWKIQTRVIYAE